MSEIIIRREGSIVLIVKVTFVYTGVCLASRYCPGEGRGGETTGQDVMSRYAPLFWGFSADAVSIRLSVP